MASIEISIIALALPDIRSAFQDESEALLSWVFSGYNITVAALLLPAGWMSERLGRRTVFCAGVLTFAIGSLAAGLAPNLNFLVAARVLQAIGGAVQVPAGMAMLLAAFPAEKRQLGIGIWGATGGLAAAFGPTAGALLVDLTSWRTVFLINVPLALLILAVAPRWLWPSPPQPGLGRVDLVGVPAASIGVGAIVLGVVQAEQWGWGTTKTLIAFATGAVLIVLFVFRSKTHPRPLFDLDLFKLRSFSVGALGQSAFVGAFFLWLIPFPSFLRIVWGWSVLKAGFAIAPGPLMAMIVAPISGRISDTIGPRMPLAYSGVLGALGVALQVRSIGTEPNYWHGVFLPSILVGIAAGIGFSGTVGAMVFHVRSHQFAMASAARSTLFQLSLSVSIALAFVIIGRPTSEAAFLHVMQITWLVAVFLYVAQALIFLAFFPRREDLSADMSS